MKVPRLRFSEFVEEWQETNAARCFEFRNGLNFTKGMEGEVVKVLGVSEFQNRHDFNDAADLPSVQISGKLDSKDILCKDDLLFVRSNGNKALIGRCLHIGDLKDRVSFSGFTIRARVTGKALDARYSTLPFRSEKFRDFLNVAGGGTNISNLSQAILGAFNFLVPSLTEQKKIAAFLQVVDAKIAALRAKVSALETYKRGLMQALFSQTLRFTKPDGTAFPDWEEKKLIELSNEKFSNGVFNDPEKVGSGYRIINVKDMYESGPINLEGLQRVAISKEEFSKNKAEYGDVFFTRSSLVKEGIAHSNVFLSQSQETTFDGHLIRLRPNKEIVNSIFLFYLLRTDELRRQLVARGKTGTMTTIGQEDIASVLILLPHSNEQQKIADALSAMDAKIQAVAAQVSHMETFKKGLLQQMFV